MEDFFKNVKIEFRLTIGEDWDDYIAKSMDNHMLWDLVHQRQFQRNTEVNQYKNVMMYTDSMQPFNLRVCVGVALDNELNMDEQKHILPDLI